jgi:hypothetical protein
MVTPVAQVTKRAFELIRDQVDSQASAVASRPNPVIPKLMRSGRRPWMEP